MATGSVDISCVLVDAFPQGIYTENRQGNTALGMWLTNEQGVPEVRNQNVGRFLLSFGKALKASGSASAPWYFLDRSNG